MTVPSPPAVGDPATATFIGDLVDSVSAAASGTVNLQCTTANVAVLTNITFPPGRFTSAPIVICQFATGVTGTVTCFAWPSNITASGCTITLNRSSTTPTAIYWLAIQTP